MFIFMVHPFAVLSFFPWEIIGIPVAHSILANGIELVNSGISLKIIRLNFVHDGVGG